MGQVPEQSEGPTDDLGRGLWPLLRRNVAKVVVFLASSLGVGGAAFIVDITARARAAEALGMENKVRLDLQEDELRVLKMNGYITCMLVKQVARERLAEIKLVLDIQQDCIDPTKRSPQR
jgi:uncharacterized protein YifN (PemK superfamily)